MTALVNDLASTCGETVLVLDDSHVIEEKQVHEILAFLIGHLPPHVHGSSPAGRIHRFPWPGCAVAEGWSKSAPRTFGFPRRRPETSSPR
jgi:hypothetical protein